MVQVSLGFTAYFVVIAAIAFSAYRQTTSRFDYDLGGRSLSAPVSALSAGASDMSGWLLLGLPGAVYVGGLSESLIVFGLLIGALLNWQYVAPRIRFFTSAFHDRVTTLPQLFALRTDDDSLSLRLVASMVNIVFFNAYVAAGFIAAAKLLNSTLGLDYQTAVIAGAAITMVYTMVGGFLAVSWSDAFQAILMLLALIVVATLAINSHSTVPTETAIFSFSVAGGFVGTLSLLAWGLGYFGQPHILARFMAIKEPEQIPRAKRIGMSWMLAASVGAIAVGFFGAQVLPGLADPETIFLELTRLVLNPWIAGFIVAAVLAAVMSTVDSQMIVASTTIVNDVLRVEDRSLWTSRAVVCIVAVCAMLFALDEESVILNVVAFAWAGLGATFGPCVLFTCYWQRTTGLGLVGGMAVGALTTIIWQFLDEAHGGVFSAIYEIIPAFIAASVTIVVVSLLTSSEAPHHGTP